VGRSLPRIAYSDIKVNSNQFFTPRLPFNSWDDLRLPRARLEGAYDWLYYLQYAAKLGKLMVF
jgi:hypothetical protein